MRELTMFQYSFVAGEKAILHAQISGNAFVQVSAPPDAPVVQSGDTWEVTLPARNVVIVVLVTFPDSTPGSRVDLTIDGEILGQRGQGPFATLPIVPASAVKSPQFQLFLGA